MPLRATLAHQCHSFPCDVLPGDFWNALQCIQRRQCGVIVGLFGNFFHQLHVSHGLVGINHQGGACTEAGERPVGNAYAVALGQLVVTKVGTGDGVVETLGGAETAEGKRQIHRRKHGDHIVATLESLGKRLCLQRAHAGVDAREDVQHDGLAAEVRQVLLRQIASHQGGVRRLVAGTWQFALQFYRVAFQSNGRHVEPPGSVGEWQDTSLRYRGRGINRASAGEGHGTVRSGDE